MMGPEDLETLLGQGLGNEDLHVQLLYLARPSDFESCHLSSLARLRRE